MDVKLIESILREEERRRLYPNRLLSEAIRMQEQAQPVFSMLDPTKRLAELRKEQLEMAGVNSVHQWLVEHESLFKSAVTQLRDSLTGANQHINQLLATASASGILDNYHERLWTKAGLFAGPDPWTGASALSSHVQAVLENWERLSLPPAFRISESRFLRITDALTNLGTAYSGFWENLSQTQLRAELDPVVIQAPPVELYQSTLLFRTFQSTTEEDELIEFAEAESAVDAMTAGLEEQLREFNPTLLKLYRGAKAVLANPNDDYVRHFTASLRELITHVLHLLCPDEDFEGWNTNPDLVSNGRPTRRGRLLYICRNVNEGRFGDFVVADNKANLVFIDLFHKGTHEADASFTPAQLRAMLRRTEGFLSYLITVGRS